MQEKEEGFFEGLGKVIILLVMGFLLTFYETWLIVKVVEWFEIPLQLTFLEWFGVISVVDIMLLGNKNVTRDKETTEIAFKGVIMKALMYTLLTGILYLSSILIR